MARFGPACDDMILVSWDKEILDTHIDKINGLGNAMLKHSFRCWSEALQDSGADVSCCTVAPPKGEEMMPDTVPASTSRQCACCGWL